jgi:DNA-binding response OmpR family regulator
MNCLLLEDDIELNDTIARALALDNYKVSSFFDGNSALSAIENNNYDIYILDINVPSINGLELLEYIYNMSNNSKVLMISSATDINTITKAYNLGCYDYIKKPFYIDELRFKLLNIKKEYFGKIKLSESVYYNLNKKQLLKNNKIIHLTKKELMLLNLLIKNKNSIITKDIIVEELFNNLFTPDVNIRAIVKRVRDKIGKNTIETISGIGYKIKI